MKKDHDECAAHQRTQSHDKPWFKKGLQLIQNLQINPGRIGDLGAGHGEFLDLCRMVYPTAELFGFDYTPVNLSSMQHKHHQTIKLDFDAIELQTFENLHALKETFDLLICFEVIEHVFDTNAFLQLAAFLLKKDGVLIISTPNLDAYPLKWFSFVRGFPYGEGHHVRFFTFPRLYSFATLNGFLLQQDKSFFAHSVAPFQKALPIRSRMIAIALSGVCGTIAFVLQTLQIWPRATKGNLLIAFTKTPLKPLGLGKTTLQEHWNALNDQEQVAWKTRVKKTSLKRNLRSSPDTWQMAKSIGLWK